MRIIEGIHIAKRNQLNGISASLFVQVGAFIHITNGYRQLTFLTCTQANGLSFMRLTHNGLLF
jgi:hypothetical protein